MLDVGWWGAIKESLLKLLKRGVKAEIARVEGEGVLKVSPPLSRKRRWQVNFGGPWSSPSGPICF